MIEFRNRSCGVAFVLVRAEAFVPSLRRDGAVPAGIEEQGIGTGGFPRNMGGPVVSLGTSRPCGGPSQCPQAPASHPAPRERTTDAPEGTAKRRKRSAAGRATGSRSALIVPSKAGQAGAPADPAEGSGASGDGTVRGKHDRDIEL